MKLPSFYLLDAVSKNVYDPYARHFASVVTSLFLDSYGLVEPGVRSKMEEMLLTWRTGGPHGRELFGVGPQVAIERGIWGSGVINDVRCLLLSYYFMVLMSFTISRPYHRVLGLSLNHKLSVNLNSLLVKQNEHFSPVHLTL